MAIAGIFTPNVLDAFIRESRVERAAAIDRVVFGPRAEEDHLVVPVRLRRIGQQPGRGERLRAGVAAETTDVGKQLGMPETDGSAVAATHRITEDGTLVFPFE